MKRKLVPSPQRRQKKKLKGRGLRGIDVDILKFLWKWKLSPTKILFRAVGKNSTPRSFVKRLKKLERNLHIEALWDELHLIWSWQLTDHGMEVIACDFAELKDLGFRSASYPHDRWVQAFLLGEWLWEKENPPQITTDQELLKLPVFCEEKGLPKVSRHRPDGYLCLTQDNKTKLIAIEVELHAKSLSRYQELMNFYRYERKIDRILWLYQNENVMAQVLKAKAEARDPSENLHLFVSLEDYIKSGWDAMLVNEVREPLFTIRELYRGLTGTLSGNGAGTLGASAKITEFFHKRKYLDLLEA